MKLLVPPPVQGLLAGGVVWGLAHLLPDYLVKFPAQTEIAILFAVIGILIDAVSILAFIRARTTVNPISPQNTRELVVSGLYRFSRNPMYLGMLLILIGWSVWVGHPLGIVPIMLFITSLTYLQIKPEERVLEEKFGDSYRGYKRRVRRWI